MEAGRAVMSSGSGAKARSDIPFAGGGGAITHAGQRGCSSLGGGGFGAGEGTNVRKCKEALVFHGHRCAHKITPLSF